MISAGDVLGVGLLGVGGSCVYRTTTNEEPSLYCISETEEEQYASVFKGKKGERQLYTAKHLLHHPRIGGGPPRKPAQASGGHPSEQLDSKS